MHHDNANDKQSDDILRRVIELREAVDRIKETAPGKRGVDELDRLLEEAERIEQQIRNETYPNDTIT